MIDTLGQFDTRRHAPQLLPMSGQVAMAHSRFATSPTSYNAVSSPYATSPTWCEDFPATQYDISKVLTIPNYYFTPSLHPAINARLNRTNPEPPSPASAGLGMLPRTKSGLEPNQRSVPWPQKASQDSGFLIYEPDLLSQGQGLYLTDEDQGLADPRQGGMVAYHNAHEQFQYTPTGCMPGSTHSLSSIEELSELPECEDIESSGHSSDGGTSSCDATPWDSVNLGQVVQSPLRLQTHAVQSQMKAPPRPRASTPFSPRAAPYSTQSPRRKRWSTGTYQSPAGMHRAVTHVTRPPMLQSSPLSCEFTGQAQAMMPHQHLPQTTYMPMTAPQTVTMHGMVTPHHEYFPEMTRPAPGQGLPHMMHSDHGPHDACAPQSLDPADHPDLFPSLKEECCDPPESDMHPEDPSMIPHKQELRYPGDLYTPRWVRGQGNKREGWCGLCKPGRWLVLKNSAFWYDKSFTHGVSATTGAPFQGPQEMRRTDVNAWEGLCGSCGEWIALVSSKKKGTTWFRHAYKCHTHPKVKVFLKRRYDTFPQPHGNGLSVATNLSSYLVKDESSASPIEQITPKTPTLPVVEPAVASVEPAKQEQKSEQEQEEQASAPTQDAEPPAAETSIIPSSVVEELLELDDIADPVLSRAEPFSPTLQPCGTESILDSSQFDDQFWHASFGHHGLCEPLLETAFAV